MNVKQIIKLYGDTKTAAYFLGVTSQCVKNWEENWKNGKPLSKWNQHAINSITNGELKVDKK